MEKLKLNEDMSPIQKRYAVEAAFLLGFQAETAVFPVTSYEEGRRLPESARDLTELWNRKAAKPPEGYRSASEHPGDVFNLDFREKKGLETMFGSGAFFRDENHDLLPDRVSVKMILPEDPERGMLQAACDLAYRFGMETTEIQGSILADPDYTGSAVVFEDSGETGLTMEEQENPEIMRAVLSGHGEDLARFVSLLCMKFPNVQGMKTWRDLLMDLTDDLTLRNADGQLAELLALKEKRPGEYQVYGAPGWTERQKKAAGDAGIYNYKSGRTMYEKTWELPWEVDVFESVLREQVYPRIREGSVLRIEGAVSEDPEVRGRLIKRVEAAVKERGGELEKAEILCAYKQGYSWITEVMLPKLKKAGADQVEICFRPFLPEGQKEWLDENGATPSYHNLAAETPDKWYDLPIRYLQELYPVEDVLVRELGIDREAVKFLVYEGDEEFTYLCRGLKDGEERCRDMYQAAWSERPYMEEYPQMGKVHPATGYLRVWVDGQMAADGRIPTDMEAIWDIYQKEVLPGCRDYIEKKTGGKITPDRQPFFHQLRLDITASEPDFQTGSREDLISSLDALHEDLYFVGSDYFKNYGMKKADAMLDAPGLILPVIHQKEGAPVFRVTLTEPLKEEPCILRGGEACAGLRERKEVKAWISRIGYDGEGLNIGIRTEGSRAAVLKAYAGLWEQGTLQMSEAVARENGVSGIVLEASDGSSYCASLPELVKPEKTKDIREIDLHEHELIGYETYREIVEELKQVPGIEVFRTAVSYTGRELYGIWLKPEYEGYLSMTKRIARIPGEMINARHHANEVSSTNAAFILLKRLLTDETYRTLPDKLNLVIVPMENVDGAAIHYELQKEHPTWKFHVARFNALGKEFYYEHFQQDTIHSEAMGLSRIFERFAPDMIVDNHGVPSHEWEQQFSGYTSPSYKGFWLPRSLLYGYFWYVTDLEYQGNYKVNKVMEDVIADKIAEYPEMRRLNLEWSAQFEKYAHAWLPKLFPADYYKEMINYWIPFAADPNHRYPSIRFPWITTVAYTSEVADETAQGEYLNLCARAHVAHDEATIRMLMEAEIVMDCRMEQKNGEIFARDIRQRPIIVHVSGENK